MTLHIIAGERRGTILFTPKGEATRPTLGRVRESLFMILMPWLGGARVLDCFAGCGALAFEALSRGAARATMIEQARPALDSIRANIEKLKWQDRTRVIARDALACLREEGTPDREPYNVIFLDPPYGADACHQAMERLGGHAAAWLAPGGVIVAQHGKRDKIEENYGPLKLVRMKDYSETKIGLFEFSEFESRIQNPE